MRQCIANLVSYEERIDEDRDPSSLLEEGRCPSSDDPGVMDA